MARKSAAVRREEILAATVEEIEATGLRALRVSDVAARLGLSASLVIYHFETKEALVAEAFDFAGRQYIDRARELREFFDLVCRDARETAYIVCACNSYELVRGVAGINVRTGKRVKFKDYEEYADFICSFLEKFAPPKQEKEDEEGGRRIRPRRVTAASEKP